MLRRYRGIFAATAGLVLLGSAPPKNAGSQPPQNAEKQITDALGEIAAPLKQAVEPSQHEEPCAKGNDNRSSDLCAQWKAADSAASAAQAAWWIGCIGALIGALTLAAAWSAAKWARKAAEHTETGAVQATRAAQATEDMLVLSREISSADLRAWIAIDIELTKIFRSAGNVSLTVKITLKNVGKTPARLVAVDIRPYLVPSIRMGFGNRPDSNRRTSPMPALMPGMEKDQSFGFTIKEEEILNAMENFRPSACFPIISFDAFATYRTILDTEETPLRVTSIRYTGVPVPKIPPDHAKQKSWLVDGAINLRSVVFRQDRHAPIEMT